MGLTPWPLGTVTWMVADEVPVSPASSAAV
jgi:hypothetical protein